MTAHLHHPLMDEADASTDGTIPTDGHESSPARRGWLLPAFVAGLLAVGLVIAGVVSASTVISVALIGGMLLMHLGGHGGHGGHSGHGGGGSAGPDRG